MNIIKEMFSTPKRAVASIAALLLIGIVAGTTIVFAALWNDVKELADEKPTAQVTIGDAQNTASEVPESDTAADGAPESDKAAGGAPAANAIEAGAKETPEKAASDHQKITQEQAEDIALKDAGISRSSADNIFSHYELDDGIYQYEVQIYKGLYEYEYNIGAENGSIFEKDIDYIYD